MDSRFPRTIRFAQVRGTRGNDKERCFMKRVLIFVAFFIFACNVFADEVWQLVPGIKESDIKDVA